MTRLSAVLVFLFSLGMGAVQAQSLAQAAGAVPMVQAVSQPAVTFSMAASSPPLTSSQPLGGPRWQNLTPAQRQALAPLVHDWDGLGAGRKSTMLELAARYQTLPPQEQARVQERLTAWVRMSAMEREKARVGYQDAHRIQAEERLAKWQAYQALPPERREELKAKAAASRKKFANALRPKEISGNKSNLVPKSLPLAGALVQPVAPALLQGKPGATTVLITQSPRQPSHQAAGQPKLIADPSLVDPNTLLPLARPVPAPASAAASAPQQQQHP